MSLVNFRGGFATNSSSSHSLIFLDHPDGGIATERDGYGWDWFLLTDKQEKRDYVACMLVHDLRTKGVGDDVIRDVVAAWGGDAAVMDRYIDHQSVMTLPAGRGSGVGYDRQFVADLFAFVEREDVGIRGGNDNDDSQLTEFPEFNIPLPLDTGRATVFSRFDAKRKTWTVFNPRTGGKSTFAFERDSIVAKDAKSDRPELVDVKITDYCTFGCKFCLVPGTRVLKKDLTWHPVESLALGDDLVGFDEFPVEGDKCRKMRSAKVEAVWKTKKRAMRITTDVGEVVCSFDHKFLMSHLGGRWLPAAKLRLGHTIAFGARPWTPPEESRDYMIGYLSGVGDGDGTARWQPLEGATKHPDDSRRQVWWRVAMVDYNPLARIVKYLDELEVSSSYEVKPFDGGSWISDSCSTLMVQPMEKVEIRSQRVLNRLREALGTSAESEEYKKGYLAGIFDAEGSYSTVLRIAQIKNNGIREKVRGYLADLGFDSAIESHGVRLRGGMWQIMRFFGVIGSAVQRKFDGWQDVGSNHTEARVLKLEDIGERDLIDIQTSTQTFYAEGMATHNCYQSSTASGKHANLYDIWNLAEILGKWKTFEVAIGGGEPTYYNEDDKHGPHPEDYRPFIRVLEKFRDHGVVPNFTTKNLGWLRDDEARGQILSAIGAFAYSVNDRDLGTFLSAIEKYKVPPEKVAINYVVGVADDYGFAGMLHRCKEAGVRVTLLGYKSVGFGATFPRNLRRKLDWLEEVAKAKPSEYGLKVSIDTALVRSAGEETLKKAGIPDWCFSGSEGTTSCYIDAVAMTTSKSSYETERATAFGVERGMEFSIDEVERRLLAAWEGM